MCAKVTGPFHGDDASGAFGKSVVHFGWKGLHVVRRWLVPANPKSSKQGDVRLTMGGTGQATRCAGATSLFTDDAKTCAPSSQTWTSYIVQYILKNIMTDATEYEAEYTAYAAHAAKATFDSDALLLELADFDISYKGTTHEYFAGLQLYMLARYGIAMKALKEGVFDRSPYDTALASWTATEVNELKVDLQNV